MSMLRLNVYDGKTVVKTYEADTYDMTFGELEDLLAIAETANLSTLRTFMHKIFEDISEDELRNTRARDIFRVVGQVVSFAAAEMAPSGDSKNGPRAVR